jgi:GT2 family glycosyltransferase
MNPQQPRVAIIIVCWNNQKLLKECFGSIRSQTYKNYVTIMVDNGSADNSVAYTKKNFPEVEVIEAGKNLGFAQGNNVGMKQALTDQALKYVVLLNTDARLKADWLEVMIGFAERHPNGALFQSVTVDYYDHDTLDSAGILFDHGLRATQIGYSQRFRMVKTGRVFGVNAAAAVYNAKFLRSSPFGDQYFDSDLFMYLEDVDIAARAIMTGWDNYVVADTEAYHMGSASTGRNSTFSLKMTYRNHLPVILKNLPGRTIIKAFPKMVRSDLARARAFIKMREYRLLWSMLSGILSGLPRLPLFLRKRQKLKQYWKVDEAELWRLMTVPELKRRPAAGSKLDPIAVVLGASPDNLATVRDQLERLRQQTHQPKYVFIIAMGLSKEELAKLDNAPKPDYELEVIKERPRLGRANLFNIGLMKTLKTDARGLAFLGEGLLPTSDWIKLSVDALRRDSTQFICLSTIGERPVPAGLIRLEKIKYVGLFNGEFFDDFAEVELALRTRMIGLSVHFIEDAVDIGQWRWANDYAQVKSLLLLYHISLPLKLLVKYFPRYIFTVVRLGKKMAVRGELILFVRALFKVGSRSYSIWRWRQSVQHRRTVGARVIDAWLRNDAAYKLIKGDYV